MGIVYPHEGDVYPHDGDVRAHAGHRRPILDHRVRPDQPAKHLPRSPIRPASVRLCTLPPACRGPKSYRIRHSTDERISDLVTTGLAEVSWCWWLGVCVIVLPGKGDFRSGGIMSGDDAVQVVNKYRLALKAGEDASH